MLLHQLEVVESRATLLAAFPVKVRDELFNRHAPVDRRVATVRRREFFYGTILPLGSSHVNERRHGYPCRVNALVRQNSVLHALESPIADKLHQDNYTRVYTYKVKWMPGEGRRC